MLKEIVKNRDYEDRHMMPLDNGHVDTCMTIAMEECAELTQAISKAKRGKLNKENLTEEIADVFLCIDWVTENYDISFNDIRSWMEKKKDRVATNVLKGEFK
ncbi:MAG: MazG nucleotide pyrophosphohydrolase domain-containing protein [Paraclostridium sp.]